jgi:ribonuclease HI
MYICSDSQASLRALEAIWITLRLVWEYRQAIRALSNRNKMTLLWVPGHSRIQANEGADASAKKGLRNPFLVPEAVVPVCLCVGGRKKLLNRIHSEYWAVTPGM